MNWNEAEILIRQTIIPGFKLDNRSVLEGGDYPCLGYDYNGAEGFKVKIGTTTNIEIPLIMLQTLFEEAIDNHRIYENKVFKNKYERQLKSHGCHVHVVGRIFERSGVAIQINNRRYRIL